MCGKGTISKSHEVKKIVMLIGKSKLEKLNQANLNTAFKIIVEVETEAFLRDVIGNGMTEESICKKILK